MISSARGPSYSSVARRRRAVSRAPAPRPASREPADRGAPAPFRRGRRWHPARLDQRPRPRSLPDGMEPIRPVRSGVARPSGLPPPAALRVLGARRLPGSGRSPAVVAARDARLSEPPYRMVGLAAAQRKDAAHGAGSRPGQRADGQRRFRGAPPGRRRLVVVASGAARPPPSLDDGRAHDPLATALPEALRPAGARAARRPRRRAR